MKTKVIVICPICGKERETYDYGQGNTRRCLQCYRNGHTKANGKGERCWAWKGGKHIRIDGYIEVYLQPDDFFFSMAGKNHYVKEHRLVMAKHIGRCLHQWEQVHHINGDVKDNRIENLLLRDSQSHNKNYGAAYSEGFRAGYEKGYTDAQRRNKKLSSAK